MRSSSPFALVRSTLYSRAGAIEQRLAILWCQSYLDRWLDTVIPQLLPNFRILLSEGIGQTYPHLETRISTHACTHLHVKLHIHTYTYTNTDRHDIFQEALQGMRPIWPHDRVQHTGWNARRRESAGGSEAGEDGRKGGEGLDSSMSQCSASTWR